MKSSRLVSAVAGLGAAILAFSILNVASAQQQPPIVSAVPGDANNPTVRHQVISGRPVTLKGAVDADSTGATWSWDPGDGSEPYTGVVGPTHWAVWAEHTYEGNSGDFFTATLTVDKGEENGGEGTATFQMVVRADSVPTRANVAIAEALWYMHRLQRRFDGDVVGVQGIEGESIIPMGNWDYGQGAGSYTTISAQAATLNAFEANGHRENGDPDNPYTETVARGMKYLMARLVAAPLAVQTVGPLAGQDTRSDDPDMNGNGVGITIDARNPLVDVRGYDAPYQLGMVMDAIVASGRPGAVATTGPDGVIGKTYSEIIQDMVDWYAMAQSDNLNHGGWRYNAWNNSGGNHDNSTSGWAGTGIVAAEDVFNAMVPDWLKVRNQNGLELTDTESDTLDTDGQHGYTDSPNPIWGPWGTTGAAMVQMSMNALEATTSATPDERWVRAENYFRRHFDDPTSGNNFKNNYYGMFNFAKAMRTAKPAPVTTIGTVAGAADGGIGCGPTLNCAAEGTKPLDWYNDPVSGLAAHVAGLQTTTGANIGQFQDLAGATVSCCDNAHVQAWATQILTRTLAQAGPIAVGAVTPNPAGEGFPITLDHSRSFHQDPERTLGLFEWDIDGDGVYDLSSNELNPDPPLVVEGGFSCPEGEEVPCVIQITLRVTDDAGVPVTATDIIILDLSIPPFAPTAIAGGPYSVCVNEELTVDGSASFDIDEGNSEPGGDPPNPPDGITLYEWEFDGVSPFDYGEASSTDDPTATWTFDTVGIAPIGLRVTDNTALSFPSAGLGNQTGTDNTDVRVQDCLDADLAVDVAVDDANPIIPQTFTVTGTISNGGPDDVTDVTVIIWVPDFVDITSITSAQGSCVATGLEVDGRRQYKCEIGDVTSGSTVDVVVEVFGDAEGTAEFEFTVVVEGGLLLSLSDPNTGNNTFTAIVNLIDEVIIVVKGKGNGSGAIALLEILLLAGLVAIVALLRRRHRRLTGALSVGIVCLLFSLPGGNTAVAAEGTWYVGGGIGDAQGDVSARDFESGLADAGYTVSDVTLKEDGSGWKFFAGYMFNEYIGLQLSFVDLGDLESEFTASVPPDQIDALLETGARLLPGRGRGMVADVVFEYPASEKFTLYATLGMFYAEPAAKQTVVEGGTGQFKRKDDEQDLAASVGMKFAVGKNFDIRIAYERYDIDGVSTDFPTATFGYRFGQ
jgi:opacity protein-like surface antigen